MVSNGNVLRALVTNALFLVIAMIACAYFAPQIDMSNFWMAYKNNLDLWSLEKENLVAAQENYRIAIDRYKLGELSGIELREAQNSLLEAEERLSVAEYSTKICEISLLQLSGQILTYIRPEPEKASF